MSTSNRDSSLANNQSRSANPNPNSGIIQSNNTKLNTSHSLQGVGQIRRRSHSTGSGQPLTDQNLVEHNRQQALPISVDDNDAIFHRARTARLAQAGRELGIAPYELRAERVMQDSQAANTMEWYLADYDLNQRMRTLPGYASRGGDHIERFGR